MYKKMKNNYRVVVIIMILMTGLIPVFAQSEAVSPPCSFHIAKEVKPPILDFVGDPVFVDADGNQVIDANEECKIVMKIKNGGFGAGLGLTAKIEAEGTTEGISFSGKRLADIPVGDSATIEYPITTDMNTADGFVIFTVYVDEPLGFGTREIPLKIQTRKFQAPLVIVKDYVVSGEQGGNLEKQKPFNLQVLIQNVQYGLAENVRVELKYPSNVFNTSEDLYTFNELSAGETKTITFPLIVNNRYEGTALPLTILISEKYGKYAQNKEITLNLNQRLANRTIEVESQVAQQNIKDVQLRSDVDRNIPETDNHNPYRYAIVIGNEDYHSYQKGLNSEQDVPFAVEDANVFKQYCVKMFGIEERNVILLNNATSAQMNQNIDFVTRLAAREGANAEIVFYYAGHGFPDENTKVPYLIPVDVNASNLDQAISLYELCTKLSNTHAQRVTVFLDACFSGGGRDASLVASRGIRLTPKKDALIGSIVVFSATSADQTALQYAEKNHGMFTYFLLKKLQESQGQCTYSELFEYLSKNVGDYSLRVNRKDQNPEVRTSPWVQDSWENWKFN